MAESRTDEEAGTAAVPGQAGRAKNETRPAGNLFTGLNLFDFIVGGRLPHSPRATSDDFHSDQEADEAFRPGRRPAEPGPHDQPGGAVFSPGAERVRENDAAAVPGGFLRAGRRENLVRRGRGDGAGPASAQRGHGVSKLRALAAPDGGGERGLRPRGTPVAAR